MLKIASYDIVFQEVPEETTLALNISGCPNRCKGCHSPHLWEDTGEKLTTGLIDGLLDRYGAGITCVCFMGGDQDTEGVMTLAEHVHRRGKKTAWYSGRDFKPQGVDAPEWWLQAEKGRLDYVKTGPYIEACGGLKSENTNQRFYKRGTDGCWTDCTSVFHHSKTGMA